MRSFAAFAGIVVVFGAVVAGAGSAFGVWDSGRGEASQPAGRAPRAAQAPAQKKQKQLVANDKQLDPQERLTRRDMAIARRAASIVGNLDPPWHEVPVRRVKGGCPDFNPDLSRLTVTGKGESELNSGRGGIIESRVKVFPDARQAKQYFRLTSGRETLDCMRNGVAGGLRKAGVDLEPFRSGLRTSRAFGDRTVAYKFSFWMHGIENPDRLYEYPVEVYTFRRGRAVAMLSFSYIAAKDDEVGLARIVDTRLAQAFYKPKA